MTPSAKIVNRESAATGKEIEHPEDSALLRLKEFSELDRVNAGNRDMGTDAVDDQRAD